MRFSSRSRRKRESRKAPAPLLPELQRLEPGPRAARVEKESECRLRRGSRVRSRHEAAQEFRLCLEARRPEALLLAPGDEVREVDVGRDVDETGVRVKVRALEPLVVRVTAHRAVRTAVVERLDGISVVEEKKRPERKRGFP